jgi:hypothetical protein
MYLLKKAAESLRAERLAAKANKQARKKRVRHGSPKPPIGDATEGEWAEQKDRPHLFE